MPDRLLTRRLLLDAFGRVGDILARREVIGEIFLVGGSVIVMEYDAREGTLDVDAFDWSPHGEIERAAATVASQLGLPRSWLNQQASAYVPLSPDWRRSNVFDHPNLRIYALDARQLLAMKILAGRARDAEDVATLCEMVGVKSSASAEALVAEIFPDETLPAHKRALLVELLDDASREM